MKLLTLIILAFLSTSYADSIDDLREEIADTESTVTNLESQLKAYEDAYKKLKKQDGCIGPFCRIRKEDTNVRAAMQVILEGGTVDGTTYPGIDKLKRDISSHRADLSQQEKELRAEEARIEKERREQEKELRARERENERRQDVLRKQEERETKLKDRELEALRRRLKTMDVETDINKLEYKTIGAELRIQEIQRAYDNSLLGNYVQEKMKLLLSSNVMCESMKSCNNGINTKANSTTLEENLRKDVFKDQIPSSGNGSGSGSGRR